MPCAPVGKDVGSLWSFRCYPHPHDDKSNIARRVGGAYERQPASHRGLRWNVSSSVIPPPLSPLPCVAVRPAWRWAGHGSWRCHWPADNWQRLCHPYPVGFRAALQLPASRCVCTVQRGADAPCRARARLARRGRACSCRVVGILDMPISNPPDLVRTSSAAAPDLRVACGGESGVRRARLRAAAPRLRRQPQ